MPHSSDQTPALRRLRLEWGGYVFTSLLFLAIFFVLLENAWGIQYAGRWMLAAGCIGLYQFIDLYVHLTDNRLKTPAAELFPTLGAANWLTCWRAIFNAALAGFLFGPWPTGFLHWAPSILYLVSALLDYVDGYVARVSGRTTRLGEDLDMKWDGVGVLVASILAVLYGQAPIPYLLVGLARYLFLFGLWVRERRGLPVYELPPNPIRRPFAGLHMGLLAVLLMPVFSPPATQLVSWVFMLPFLTNFLLDWLAVSGVIRQSKPVGWLPANRQPHGYSAWLPLAVRILLIGLLLNDYFSPLNQMSSTGLSDLIALAAVLALLVGAAGRLFSLVVLLMTGFALQHHPLDLRLGAILLLSALLMMLGTGRFSLWKPEDWLLYKRAGEKQPVTQPHH